MSLFSLNAMNTMKRRGRIRNVLQKTPALHYHNLPGVPTNKPCSILDIPMFEQVLNINVCVLLSIYTTMSSIQTLYIYLAINWCFYIRCGNTGHFVS